MAVIHANQTDYQLLARLMRAEAEEDGDQGMLMVGNTAVNRVRVNCLDFNNIRTVPQMVYQSPGGFEATQKPYFYQRAREREIRLAKDIVSGNKYYPASYSLWFFRPTGACPATWFNQPNAGRYKAHCFFHPYYNSCPQAYGVY